MQKIISYLLNPNKAGTYFTRISINESSLKELFSKISEYDEKREIKRDSYKFLDLLERGHFPNAYRAKTALEDLAKAVTHLSIWEPTGEPLSGRIFSPKDGLDMKNIASHRDGVRRHAYSNVFLEPNLAIPSSMDAINTSTSFSSGNFIINVFSAKESGCKAFEKFVRSIPIIGKKASVSYKGKKYSSRYCYEPYPAATMLWSCCIVNESVPREILDYFDGSIRYWERSEWRISVILSAIAVESLLAEICEEYYHDIAPSDPLGALRDRIEKKHKLPPKTRRDVDLVNRSRISAVHRSSMRVGEQEARNALVGATRFTHWAFSEGPLAT
jgi:hypothetical protein